MKILIVAEHDNKVLKSSNFHSVTAALQLGAEIELLIVGDQCEQVVKSAEHLPHIQKIKLVDAKEFEHQLAENTSAVIAQLATQYQYVIAPASTFGKNIFPRVAALLDVAMLGDIIKIVNADTFVRPIYAGNALATVQTSDAIKVMTIRTTAFSAAVPVENNAASLEKMTITIPNGLSTFEKQELTVSVRPDLADARIVVSGGRGLKSAENFKLVEELADQLGAAIGASRAAVDAGFAPNDYQVGQTGKIVAPELYIAIGISGAIQHLAGMKDSKVIVAINNDPDAPIFAIADYGLVGDLFTTIKELRTELASIQ